MNLGMTVGGWLIQAVMILGGIAGIVIAGCLLYRGRERSGGFEPVPATRATARSAGGGGRRRT